MTPSQVLEEAMGRFMVLYHNDPTALSRLLRQALGKYQDKAGVLLENWVGNDGVACSCYPLPSHFHSMASCCDARRRHVAYRIQQMDDGSTQVKLLLNCYHEAPYSMVYFAGLRDWPNDEELPNGVTSLLGDYLEALIAVQNTERQRNVMLSTGQNASDLPTYQDLKARIVELELCMEESKAMAPPISMF